MRSNAMSASEYKKKKKLYKCPDCSAKYKDPGSLYDHVDEHHSSNIPKDWTTKRYVFNKRNKKTHGNCVICRRETEWNEIRGRYERYCSEKCKMVARENFRKNAKDKLGTDNPAADPEHQLKAIRGRKYSGEYEFEDGGKVWYSSSYESDFLRFCDEEMNFKSTEIMQCEIIFSTIIDGKEHFHIPDFFIPMFDLIIQIKDGGDNPNMNSHVQGMGRERQRLGDQAIINDGRYNYIKIVNKEYDQFIGMINMLKEKDGDSKDGGCVIVILPE